MIAGIHQFSFFRFARATMTKTKTDAVGPIFRRRILFFVAVIVCVLAAWLLVSVASAAPNADQAPEPQISDAAWGQISDGQ